MFIEKCIISKYTILAVSLLEGPLSLFLVNRANNQKVPSQSLPHFVENIFLSPNCKRYRRQNISWSQNE
jgi:hypothetical protein